MQTFKTAVVVVVLLAILYGVYIVLNTPEDELPDLAWPDVPSLEPPSMSIGYGNTDGAPNDPNFDPHGTWPEGDEAPRAPVSPYAEGAQRDMSDQPSRNAVPSGVQDRPEHPATAPSPPPSSPASPNDQTNSADGPTSYYAQIGRNRRDSADYRGEYFSAADLETTRPEQDSGSIQQHASSDVSRSSTASSGSMGMQVFSRGHRTAMREIAEGRYVDALQTLSMFYKSPDLTGEEQAELLDILDPLAARVIYSTDHLLSEPHRVGRDEDLFEISAKYHVPWQLLANINGIDDPRVLVPGTLLKVVPGPFTAELDIADHELTLFVDGLYAGRFPVTLGDDPRPVPGTYRVKDKQRDRTYYSGDGRTFPSGDPANPFGSIWLDLGNDVAIHGSAEAPSSYDDRLGCISLSPRDARDVYGILSIGSEVIIR